MLVSKPAVDDIGLIPVSTVIPCYRCADTIQRAVSSVAAQTLKPAEVILIDDCSGDGTLEVLYQLQADYPKGWIKVIPLLQNGGAATARNVGWKEASCSYIAFLDADDSWHHQKIEIQYGWMKQHPDVVLTGHKYAIVENTGTIEHHALAADTQPRRVTKWPLLFSNHFPTPSVMLRRELKFRFKEGKRYSEDFLLWLQICLSNQACFLFDAKLTYLYKPEFGVGGLSSHLWALEQGELDTYHEIYKQKTIGFWAYMFLVCYSQMKFIRRLFLSRVVKRFC